MSNARDTFPRGLAQPKGGFRFGADSLLLAAFAAPLGGMRVLDLGAGCGVVGLGLALLMGVDEAQPPWITGMDIDPDMVAAAKENASLLGLEATSNYLSLDLRAIRESGEIEPESMDLAVANPPFYLPGSGREPAEPSRNSARFEQQATLAQFAAAAFYALINRGSLCLVMDAERLADLLVELRDARMEPKRLRLVHSRMGEQARLALVQARKNGRPGLRVDPPLALYAGQGAETRLTEQALEFCPFLACNAAPGLTSDPA